MTVSCMVYVPTKAWDLCGEPAAGLIRAGCVHEHVIDKPVCEAHADLSDAGCIQCLTADEGAHECAVLGEFMRWQAR